jgi:hypothetical protein
LGVDVVLLVDVDVTGETPPAEPHLPETQVKSSEQSSSDEHEAPAQWPSQEQVVAGGVPVTVEDGVVPVVPIL